MMDHIIVKLKTISNTIIYEEKYINNTYIYKIKYDLLYKFPLTNISLVYNEIVLSDHNLLYELTCDEEIILDIIMENTLLKMENGIYLIEYYKSKFIIHNIDNPLIKPYTCLLDILKIIKIINNLIVILTTDNELYYLRLVNNDKYKITKKYSNIINITYNKPDDYIYNEYIFCIFFKSGIIKIQTYSNNYTFKLYNNVIIRDINNISNIYIFYRLLLIETINNTIIIYNLDYLNIKYKNDKKILLIYDDIFILYENVRKILFCDRNILFLTFDNDLYSISIKLIDSDIEKYSKCILDKKFTDINYNGLFIIGILENNTILIYKEFDLEYIYLYKDFLIQELKNNKILVVFDNEYITHNLHFNIKTIDIYYEFLYILYDNNTVHILNYTNDNIMYNNVFNNVINIFKISNFEIIIVTNINIIIINSYLDNNNIQIIHNKLLYENILNYYSFGNYYYALTNNKLICFYRKQNRHKNIYNIKTHKESNLEYIISHKKINDINNILIHKYGKSIIFVNNNNILIYNKSELYERHIEDTIKKIFMI